MVLSIEREREWEEEEKNDLQHSKTKNMLIYWGFEITNTFFYSFSAMCECNTKKEEEEEEEEEEALLTMHLNGKNEKVVINNFWFRCWFYL